MRFFYGFKYEPNKEDTVFKRGKVKLDGEIMHMYNLTYIFKQSSFIVFIYNVLSLKEPSEVTRSYFGITDLL